MNTYIRTFNLVLMLSVILAVFNSCASRIHETERESVANLKSHAGLCVLRGSAVEKNTIHNIPIEWTQYSPYDSLSVFCSEGKRGYYNSRTDEIVIPAKYRRAWIFSDGIAAVQDDDKIGFIDCRGEIVIDFMFPYEDDVDYVFQHGVCVVADKNGKFGVIDKDGEWLIIPEWDHISAFHDYAIVSQREVSQQMGYDGVIMNSFVLEDIQELIYSRVEYTEYVVGHIEEREVIYYTGLYAYQVGGRWGMMDSNCKRLTEPLYDRISAMDQNIYRGLLSDGYHEVILNAKGEIMN